MLLTNSSQHYPSPPSRFFRKKHTDQLKNLMVDIVSVILAEYESVPFILLELLFARIIDPEKVRINQKKS